MILSRMIARSILVLSLLLNFFPLFFLFCFHKIHVCIPSLDHALVMVGWCTWDEWIGRTAVPRFVLGERYNINYLTSSGRSMCLYIFQTVSSRAFRLSTWLYCLEIGCVSSPPSYLFWKN